MTDRELLELAAKAAGIKTSKPHYTDALMVEKNTGGCIAVVSWNPLTDDGDALRLSALLRFTIKVADHEIEIFDMDGACLVSIPVFDQDIENVSGTVRRAITRAAAEIGKQK